MRRIHCPICGKRLRVAAELIGKRGRCSTCKQPISIPADDAPLPWGADAGDDSPGSPVMPSEELLVEELLPPAVDSRSSGDGSPSRLSPAEPFHFPHNAGLKILCSAGGLLVMSLPILAVVVLVWQARISAPLMLLLLLLLAILGALIGLARSVAIGNTGSQARS